MRYVICYGAHNVLAVVEAAMYVVIGQKQANWGAKTVPFCDLYLKSFTQKGLTDQLVDAISSISSIVTKNMYVDGFG